MNKQRSRLITLLLMLLIFITSLSIAYAVLSTSLSISGNAEVQASSWEIILKEHTDTSSLVYETTGSATYTLPTLTGTSIENYSVEFTKPGDSVTFQFAFSNNGTLPGELTSIITLPPTCTSSTGSTSDASLVCDNLIYNLRYADGTPVSIGDVVADAGSIYSYVCFNGSTQDAYSGTGNNRLLLTIGYSQEATEVPSSTVTISNLKTEFLFSQTEKTCTNGGSSTPPS